MRILNLTQHPATPEQLAAGVIDVEPEFRGELISLLTFDEPPTQADMDARGHQIANLAGAYTVDTGIDENACSRAMIGGAPFFMSTLEKALKDALVIPIYAFSKRESVEEKMADGSVKKVNVFRHAGFVEV